MYKCSQWGATEKAACVCEVLSFIYGDVRKQLRQIVEALQEADEHMLLGEGAGVEQATQRMQEALATPLARAVLESTKSRES